MANMEERLETVVTQAETDVSKWHTIVHGDENSTVETENGDVPTVAKQLKDIREAITGGVSDVVAEAESARDEAKSVRDNALTIKNEIEQLKTDTEEATETAKSYKNMAQTTFNSISSAVNKGLPMFKLKRKTKLPHYKQPETHRSIARKQPPPSKYS